jgi:hypothetical protein
MNWNCTRTEERLSDLLEGLLATDEAAAFSAHAAGCEDCTQLVALVGGTTRRIQELPLRAEPPFLASRIIALTRSKPAPDKSRKGWLAWSPAIWQTRFAMGIVTVAATFLIVFHAVSSGMPGKFELSPANLYHDANRRIHLTYAHGARFVNNLRVVYEIQSRLSSQPEPVPATHPEEQRPDPNAPNTQTTPPASRPAIHEAAEFAVVMMNDGPKNVLEPTRSR